MTKRTPDRVGTQPASTQRSRVRLLLIIAAIAIAVAVALPTRREAHDGPSTYAGRRIPYTTVKSWTVPSGGRGRVIVVDRKYRNETDLRTLGEELRWEARDDSCAYVEIYDDRKAAGMRDAAMDLSARDASFHDRHEIAVYEQGNRKRQLLIALHGITPDDWITVTF